MSSNQTKSAIDSAHAGNMQPAKHATKVVALVGHCGPDSSFLKIAVAKALGDVKVTSADDEASLQKLISNGVDLLLLNRQLDYGFGETEGVDLIARVHASNPDVRMMLVSNYAESQLAAERAGAVPGFGKREMGSPRVAEVLRAAVNV